jgi:hypothetical protein
MVLDMRPIGCGWIELLQIKYIKVDFKGIVPQDTSLFLIMVEGVSFVKFFRGKVIFQSKILNSSLRIERRKIVSHYLRWNMKL